MPNLSDLFSAGGFLKWDGAGNTDADYTSQAAADLAADAAFTGAFAALDPETGEVLDGDGNPVTGSVAANIEVEGTGYPARPSAPLVIWRGWNDPTGDAEFLTGVDLWSQADAPTTSWFTDFSADTPGSPPSGWTSRWTAFTSTNVVDDTGTNILRLVKNSGVNYAFLSWDDVPAAADVEVVMKFRLAATLITGTSTQRAFCFIRAAGTSHAEADGYLGQLLNGATYARVRPYHIIDGSGAYVGSTGVDVTDYDDMDWNWMRLRANGTTISIKVWPDSSAEPGSWHVTGTDSNVTAAGMVGVGWYITGQVDIGAVGVAIDGETAPTSAP